MIPSAHRQTWAEIDLSAICRNIIKIKKHISEQAKLWAVVKANAYGHGAVRVAQAVEKLTDGFCVSNLDEAIQLREAGIKKKILILAAIAPQNTNIAKDYKLTITAPSLEWLSLVLNEGQDLLDLEMQIKVDSGMGRIGIKKVEEANLMIEMMDKAGIIFDGIFTHFATADESETEKFDQQVRYFDCFILGLTRRPRYVHSTNSAAAIWHPDQVQDVERLGLGLYGLDPSNAALSLPFDLEPALSLKSEISHIKKVKKGETIGYGATYIADETTFIATLPIGYADGWTRSMQSFFVLIDGKFCEIIGRVSMDQMTIKLDKAYPLGTEVTLIGKDKQKKITVDEIANWRHTINYEVITTLSDRIYRKYIN
ncbi:MAG: alanine racemase [Lactovum sp.]